MWWMRTDVGRTGERQCAFTTGRWRGRAGQRGAFGGKRGKEGEREREFRDECFMGMYHAAKNIPLKSQSGIFTSIKARQRRFLCIYFICCVFCLVSLQLFIEKVTHKHRTGTIYITDGLFFFTILRENLGLNDLFRQTFLAAQGCALMNVLCAGGGDGDGGGGGWWVDRKVT